MEAVEKKKRLPEWAVKLLIWCVPSLVLLGAFTFLFGRALMLERVNIPIFCVILLIGLVVTRLIFLFRSRRTVWAKIWRAAVWVVLLVFLVYLFPFFPVKVHIHTRKDAQSEFESSASEIYGAFPVTLELGPAKTVEYHMFYEWSVIWQTQSHMLLCRYDPSDYDAAKTSLETRYSFRKKSMDTEHSYLLGKEVAQVEPYARIGDDCFRFLLPADGDDQDGWDGAFYKRCLMVVTNDVEHEIGFILFYDFDLDMAEDLTEFINDYCGWKYIR